LYIIFKYPILNARKTNVSVAKVDWLMLFMGFYSEKHSEPINALCGQNAEINWEDRWYIYRMSQKYIHIIIKEIPVS
jgi:hypothetical protein